MQGKYLAEERGAFDAEPVSGLHVVEPASKQARAPLYEFAAAHENAPPLEWLGMFMQFAKTGVLPVE